MSPKTTQTTVLLPFSLSHIPFRRQYGQLLTEKADIYSLGMIFFALIAGRLPYYGKPELLESAFYQKGRPKIDPSWHRGFMEVCTTYLSRRAQKQCIITRFRQHSFPCATDAKRLLPASCTLNACVIPSVRLSRDVLQKTIAYREVVPKTLDEFLVFFSRAFR